MFRTCETNFNLERHLIMFFQDTAFYSEISRHIRKVPTKDIPTAGVTYNLKVDELQLYWNPDFFASLNDAMVRGVLKHEFMHIIFGHLNARRKKPNGVWNVATDLAINSLILENRGSSNNSTVELPDFVFIPGQRPVSPKDRKKSKDEEFAKKLGDLIESFPKLKSSEWYYYELKKFAEENPPPGGGEGEPGFTSFDDHDMWDDIPEEQREFVENKIKAVVEKAVRHADGQPNGWGNIPADIREEIRRSVSRTVNWRSVLRQFVGTLVRGSRSTSIKSINKRFPYMYPGLKRGYQAKLLIAIDQSGSVGDEMLAQFFAELGALTKKVDISVLPFDCSADVADVYEWKKGMALKAKRTKAGGTDFGAPTAVFNDPKNRGKWDGMLIMTDGQAPAPSMCRGKRGWVLGEGCKLYFASNELQIFINKDQVIKGAWR